MQADEIAYPNGALMVRAFLARPSTTGRYPAVIVIQEWWGLNDHIKAIAQRLAIEGFAVLAPDLYSRMGRRVTKDAKEAAGLMGRLRQVDGLSDLTAAVAFLKQHDNVNPKKLGALGFCMGGTYALLLATHSVDLKASVAFYGQVPPTAELRRLHCPVLYVAAGQDNWITRDEVKRLQETLPKVHNPGSVQAYPNAPHAFFNDTRPDVYRPAEAQDAWRRTLQFFHQHLS